MLLVVLKEPGAEAFEMLVRIATRAGFCDRDFDEAFAIAHPAMDGYEIDIVSRKLTPEEFLAGVASVAQRHGLAVDER